MNLFKKGFSLDNYRNILELKYGTITDAGHVFRIEPALIYSTLQGRTIGYKVHLALVKDLELDVKEYIELVQQIYQPSPKLEKLVRLLNERI